MNGFNIAVVIAITLCYGPGLYLRYSPFRVIATKKEKCTLFLSLIMLGLGNIFFMWFIREFFVKDLMLFSRIIGYDYILFGMISVIISILVIRGYTKEHLFSYGVVTITNYMMLSVATYVAVHIPDISPQEKYMVGTIVLIIFIGISFYPLLVMLKRTVEPYLIIDSGNYWKGIWFIPVGMLFSMILSVPFYDNVSTWYQLMSRLLVLCVTLVVCYVVAMDYGNLIERQNMTEQLQMSKAHYAELLTRVEQARKTRHDMKHMINAIRQYIANDDKSGLSEFCDDLQERNDSGIAIPYTGNAAIDGVIWHYMLKAEEHNIQMEYKGTIQSDSIADLDLCVLFGNALDNAVAGCLTIPDNRRITVVAQTEKYLLSIMFNNTYDGKVEIKDDMMLSRKREEQIPGIGIDSMKEVCERYGGTLDTKWDEHTFTGIILLPQSGIKK